MWFELCSVERVGTDLFNSCEIGAFSRWGPSLPRNAPDEHPKTMADSPVPPESPVDEPTVAITSVDVPELDDPDEPLVLPNVGDDASARISAEVSSSLAEMNAALASLDAWKAEREVTQQSQARELAALDAEAAAEAKLTEDSFEDEHAGVQASLARVRPQCSES